MGSLDSAHTAVNQKRSYSHNWVKYFSLLMYLTSIKVAPS